MPRRTLGVIVNPVAGMGGRVGLKGSDGVEILRRARELGARPEAPGRMALALKAVSEFQDQARLLTYPGQMGEESCALAGLPATVIGRTEGEETTPEDTRRAARQMAAAGADLILFAGGDGTARDLYHAVGEEVPVLGVPAGVKIHSAVYAVTPRSAGELVALWLQRHLLRMRSSEVMDIDEEAFRAGVVRAKLYGYLQVPEENRFVQNVKAGGVVHEAEALQGICTEILRAMEDPDCIFAVGPGTTTRGILQALELENTLLGVDVVRNRKLLANDVTARQLLDLIGGHRAKVVVTAIGGQGHILGRGNQQISPEIIRQVGRENLLIIATKEKLVSLRGRPLLVDTGDAALDQELSGYTRIITGYGDYVIYKVGY